MLFGWCLADALHMQQKLQGHGAAQHAICAGLLQQVTQSLSLHCPVVSIQAIFSAGF